MRDIDVHKIADEAKFNGFHGVILFWCALIIIFDGYDLAVAGIALPSIMKDMGLEPTKAGFVVSSALFGMMFGAIALGTIADRFGRRLAISACVALFSVFTAASGLTRDPVVFAVMRFFAGLGIGGAMPCAVAQMTEYSPIKLRGRLVTLMFSGYSVGGVLAALLGKSMIETYGWQSVFIAAGAPVLLIPFIMKAFPESMPYLIKQGRLEELKKVVCRLEPDYVPAPDHRYSLPRKDKADRFTVRHLFQEGRGLSTIMFWITFFMCLFMVYALSSWLAKLMASAGYSLGSALTFVLVLNAGAIVGAVGGGWLADRFQIRKVLIGMYALAAVSITLLGIRMPQELLFIVVALAGASTIGTQIVTYAYVGQYYPMAIRSTGIGWASGMGRTGAILAPIVIGALVGMKLPLEMNFAAIAIPAVVAVVAMTFVKSGRPQAKAAAQSPQAALLSSDPAS